LQRAFSDCDGLRARRKTATYPGSKDYARSTATKKTLSVVS
jgi:hypothetical protein